MQSNVEIQAIGPNRKQYVSCARSLRSQLAEIGIKLNVSDLDSDSRWSSVIIAVDSSLELESLCPMVESLLEIKQEESGIKTDITIQDTETNSFYDLPEQWSSLLENMDQCN